MCLQGLVDRSTGSLTGVDLNLGQRTCVTAKRCAPSTHSIERPMLNSQCSILLVSKDYSEIPTILLHKLFESMLNADNIGYRPNGRVCILHVALTTKMVSLAEPPNPVTA